MAQSNPNWVAHVVADCPPVEIQEEITNIILFFNDDRIKLSFLNERANDWGHTPRNYGLKNATEEWVVLTGEDNYYTPVFVDEFLSAGYNPLTTLVYCNMVHNWISNQYYPIQCELEFGKIDVGCFAIRRFIAQKLTLRTDVPEADWFYLEEYLTVFEGLGTEKIDKILYVHN
jgi:glycosyltransferase involved in cell wall biosynthesis